MPAIGAIGLKDCFSQLSPCAATDLELDYARYVPVSGLDELVYVV